MHEPGPRTHSNPNSTSWELVLRGQSVAIGVPSAEHRVSRVALEMQKRLTGAFASQHGSSRCSAHGPRRDQHRWGQERGKGDPAWGPCWNRSLTPRSAATWEPATPGGGATRGEGRHQREGGTGRGEGHCQPEGGTDAKALRLPRPPRQLVPWPRLAPLSSVMSSRLPGSQVHVSPS